MEMADLRLRLELERCDWLRMIEAAGPGRWVSKKSYLKSFRVALSYASLRT